MPPKTKSRKRKVAAASVPTEHEASIKEAFDTYANDEGRLSVKRVKQALKDGFDVSLKKDEIRAITDESMDYNMFARFCSNKLRQKDKADKAFGLFDKDGKGLVCLEDVERVARELGEDFTEDQVEEMMNEADPSGEGFLDRDAFFRIIRKLNL